MTTQRLALAITILSSTIPAAAQDLSPALRASAACAPVGTHGPSDAPKIRATGPRDKALYNAGEQVVIDRGAKSGLEVGQRFFVRRAPLVRGASAEHTVGWLRIAELNESTAKAIIDFTCDAIAVGDHLEPYVEPVLPLGVDRTDATGTPDRSKSAKVLYGNDGRQLGGGRDFILAAAGQDRGVVPGARYAVYRGVSYAGAPRDAFGEAIVVTVFGDKSLLRITDARDAVSAGDTLVLRVGGGLKAHALVAAQDPLPLNQIGGEGAPLDAEEGSESARSFSFEDLSFDFNRYTLKAEAIAELDQAVTVLEQNPALHIHIEGYSCNVGSAKYNLALGARRAKAARDYLISRGVTASRLTTTSFGEAKPKYDNSKKETRQLNRRAALVVNIQSSSAALEPSRDRSDSSLDQTRR